MKKFKTVMALGLATLTFPGLSPQAFASELDTSSIQEEQSTEVSYTLVETSVEGEYVAQPIEIGPRSYNDTLTVTLGAGMDTLVSFDNSGVLWGTHSKVKVTIKKNPSLPLKVTLINRDTGATVDSTNFNSTGEFTFNLDSGLADYKLYIRNTGNTSGQITFSVKTS